MSDAQHPEGAGEAPAPTPAPDGAVPVAPEPAPEAPEAAPVTPEAGPPAPPAYAPPAPPYAGPAPAAAPYPGAAPTGAPTAPYGEAGQPGAVYAPVAPPAGPGDSRPKLLAIIALALSGLGLVMAFIPFVTFFSGLFLLAGFVVGLIALIGKKHGGTPLSITALALAVVGWIVSLVMTFVTVGMIGQSAIEEAIRDSTSSGVESGSGDSGASDESADDTAEVTADVQDLVVSEVAFGRQSYDSESWWYVVIIDNPNEDYIWDFGDFTVEALDASGTILDSSPDYRTVLSGRSAISGTFFSVGSGEISELSVMVPDASRAIQAPADETGAFTIADLQAESDSYSTTVRGTISGDFADDQELVEIVVVARDGAGTIIGTEFTYVDRVPAGGTKVQFEATWFDVLPEGTVFEAYSSL